MTKIKKFFKQYFCMHEFRVTVLKNLPGKPALLLECVHCTRAEIKFLTENWD